MQDILLLLQQIKTGKKVIDKRAEFKYLGVCINDFLEFKKNIEVLGTTGKRGLVALKAEF